MYSVFSQEGEVLISHRQQQQSCTELALKKQSAAPHFRRWAFLVLFFFFTDRDHKQQKEHFVTAAVNIHTKSREQAK